MNDFANEIAEAADPLEVSSVSADERGARRAAPKKSIDRVCLEVADLERATFRLGTAMIQAPQ